MTPPAGVDGLTAASEMLAALAGSGSHRFLAFTESRKHTEYLAALLARRRSDEADPSLSPRDLSRLQVLPYRSGYEEQDRVTIQDRLAGAKVRGVVSTSALELGIDVPHLTTVVLYGVPRNRTSLFQRIGRVGRGAPGEVLIVNTHDLQTERVFASPAELLNMPRSEAALYLGNPRIQFIHALCLARRGGELDRLADADGNGLPEGWAGGAAWPASFIEACERLRRGHIPAELQAMAIDGGEDPHHAFPLRDVDTQFRVEERNRRSPNRMGSLTWSQLMRESYPGAVYYYGGRPYRVTRVNTRGREVSIRTERYYTTTPKALPTQVYPNTETGGIYAACQWDTLRGVECDVQVRRVLTGYSERRGNTVLQVNYPLDPQFGAFHDHSTFSRTIFSTATILIHPALNALATGELTYLAELILEAFLTVIPVERQDLDAAAGKLGAATRLGREGTRFIALFDQTYGSLRLTGRVFEGNFLARVLERAVELARFERVQPETAACMPALRGLTAAATGSAQPWVVEAAEPTPPEEDEAEPASRVRVIHPGSVGLNTRRGNVEFLVEDVVFSPAYGGLAYRGRHLGGEAVNLARGNGSVLLRADTVAEIAGVSEMAWFDCEEGKIDGDATGPR